MAERGPLYGIPFAVKDNVDVASFPTTAACPAFEYTPKCSAPAVEALLQAGGIMVGKTNMDQFATGLVGTRSPYGTARNAFDDRFVPGGSSSGSGAVVGLGLVSFAIGTDTAGSGRIPAQFNGCVGIKPTVGKVSTSGVVPACRSLDCLSCFARSVKDAALVIRLMQEAGQPGDPCWRPQPALGHAGPDTMSNGNAHDGSLANGHGQNGHAPPTFTFGVPSAEFLDFSGPGGPAVAAGYSRLFREAVERMQALGGQLVPIDLAPFDQAAPMLYQDAFLAERYSAIRSFLERGKGMPSADKLRQDSRMERVLGAILSGSLQYTAADLYDAQAKLKVLTAEAHLQLDKVDFLLVPTALHHYTIMEVEATEKHAETPSWPFNAKLGKFTNFVNLMDMCAVSVPSGILRCPELDHEDADGLVASRAQHLAASGNPTPVLPFGVTLLSKAWKDEYLWGHASRFHKASGLGCGPAGHQLQPFQTRQHSEQDLEG